MNRREWRNTGLLIFALLLSRFSLRKVAGIVKSRVPRGCPAFGASL